MVATRSQRAAAAEANFDLDEVDNNNNNHDRSAATTKFLNNKDAQTTTTCEDEEDIEVESKSSEYRSYVIIIILAIITYVAYPGVTFGKNGHEPTIHTVFYYGWVSCISTGFGVLPLCFVSEMKEYWIGVSNAIAAGMMCAASYSLFIEGCTFHDINDVSCLSPTIRTCIGCFLGLLFILGTKRFLDENEDVKLGSLNGADTRKILLIIFVMTLHSFSEGVGIGEQQTYIIPNFHYFIYFISSLIFIYVRN